MLRRALFGLLLRRRQPRWTGTDLAYLVYYLDRFVAAYNRGLIDAATLREMQERGFPKLCNPEKCPYR